MGLTRKQKMDRAAALLGVVPKKPDSSPLREPLDLVREILIATKYPDTMTLGELRETLLKKMTREIRCPLCSRRVALRVRPLSYPIVQALRWLVDTSGTTRKWIHVPTEAPTWCLRSRQHSALSLWKLAETLPVNDPASLGAGTWRPTRRGVEFAQGLLKVPSKAVTYNGKLLGFSGEMIAIGDVQGNPLEFPIPQVVLTEMPEERKAR